MVIVAETLCCLFLSLAALSPVHDPQLSFSTSTTTTAATTSITLTELDCYKVIWSLF